jgi:CRISPR-associated protein Cmr3
VKADQVRRPDDVYGFDDRTGIRVDPYTLTAADSQIYAIRLLVLRKGYAFYAEVSPGPGAPDLAPLLGSPIALGGEGRHARVCPLKTRFSWPEAPPGERNLWLLTTPAPLRHSARPEVVTEPARVVAAAAGSPLAVSGWDVARGGPRPTRFAVPAGATYFVTGNFTPTHGSFCADADAAAEGWGVALRGAWNHD